MIDTIALKQLAINKFKLDIKSVISGEEDVAISELISAGDINNYIESIGLEWMLKNRKIDYMRKYKSKLEAAEEIANDNGHAN